MSYRKSSERKEIENNAETIGVTQNQAPNAGVQKKNFAALIFIVIYAYPSLNSFIPVKGAPGLYLDVLLFSITPAVCFYSLCRGDPIFRLMLRDGLRRCSFKNLTVLLMCGICFAYLYMYTPKYFNGNDEAVGDPASYALQAWGLMGVFYLAFSAGVIEELLYKALLNYAIPWRVGNITFSIISGAVFGAAHLEQGIAAVLTLILFFGIPSAYFYRVSNNLLGLIIMHFAIDFLLFGRVWAWLYA